MQQQHELIHANVYDPSRSLFKSNRNDKASATALFCSNKDNCGLYARGECAMIAILNSQHCPYGKRSSETGFTRKARGYYTWIGERTEKYKAAMNKLNRYSTRMAVVGDFVFLPYPHMNMNQDVPFGSHGGAFNNGEHFVKLESFGIDLVKSIVLFRPQALFGGEITSYQDEVVPKFLIHLKESMPDLYAKAADMLPHVAGIVAKFSNVGRKALLRSLKPGTVVTKYHKDSNLKTQHWSWDGELLTSTDAGISFPIVSYDECTVTIRPKPDASVEVTSEDQVDEDTEYVD